MNYEKDLFYKKSFSGIEFYTTYVYIKEVNDMYYVYLSNESNLGGFEIVIKKFHSFEKAKEFVDDLNCEKFWFNFE